MRMHALFSSPPLWSALLCFASFTTALRLSLSHTHTMTMLTSVTTFGVSCFASMAQLLGVDKQLHKVGLMDPTTFAIIEFYLFFSKW